MSFQSSESFYIILRLASIQCIKENNHKNKHNKKLVHQHVRNQEHPLVTRRETKAQLKKIPRVNSCAL